jgi:hypothetical protein
LLHRTSVSTAMPHSATGLVGDTRRAFVILLFYYETNGKVRRRATAMSGDIGIRHARKRRRTSRRQLIRIFDKPAFSRYSQKCEPRFVVEIIGNIVKRQVCQKCG